MIIGVLREARPAETRVAATPTTVAALVALGYAVVVEPGAGVASAFSDEAYAGAGATIGAADAADVVFGVNAPSAEQLDGLRAGTTLVCLISPALNPDLLTDLARRRITAFAMDAVPRISRAQSLDVLSSMANIAGYRAVIEAANVFGRFFTGQITAAGKVPPAKVLVAGVGVAGLAAIGTAGGMGAIVYATDPRPEVADQVVSLGGEYLAVEAADVEVSATGYAKEMCDDYNARAAALYAARVPDVDIIITTALIPGRPAPRLITAEMVASMKPGSVIVDMAASNGGNVEGTVAEQVVTHRQRRHDHRLHRPRRAPGRAGLAALRHEPGQPDEADDAGQGRRPGARLGRRRAARHHRGPRRRGEPGRHPPCRCRPPRPPRPPAATVVKAEKPPPSPGRRFATVGLSAGLLLLLVAAAPAALRVHLTVFALAIVIGYYVIGNVHHALHTPLMSVTNAISGIIVVGALLQIGHGDTAITTLSFVAILLASINVFGGFAVTRRMLSMFSRS